MSSQKRRRRKAGQCRHIIPTLAGQEAKKRERMSAMDRYNEKVRKQDEQKHGRTGLDRYSNPLAGLGASSRLLSAGTFLPVNLTRDTEELTNMYRGSWLAKKIIDMPAEDMTRNWYTLSTSLPREMLQELAELEATHSVKQEITNAIRWSRLYGGCIALIVLRGEEEILDRPLDIDMLLQDCFHGLLVLDRTCGITPSAEKEEDLDDPDFGLPKYYDADLETGEETRHVRIHHSRVIRFIGRELPQREMIREDYWGASELEHIMDELMKRESASANIAQLLFQANMTTLKSGEITAMLATGTAETREGILSAVEDENRIRTSYGIQLLGADDEIANLQYNFNGLADIDERFMRAMAGAAEIPATKLFGQSPDGMNATGEADLRNYYDMISSLQERILRPALAKLLPIMAISCW